MKGCFMVADGFPSMCYASFLISSGPGLPIAKLHIKKIMVLFHGG